MFLAPGARLPCHGGAAYNSASLTRSETEQLFERRLDAWRRRDIDALGQLHTEDGVLESPIAGRVTGRAAIENVYRAFLVSFPDVVTEQVDLVIDGDRAVQTLMNSGTNTGSFLGMPPTGRRFSFLAVMLCTLRDGRIAHEQRVYDFTGLLMEIGLLRAKPA
jgi:steroid delta-isomerase-like uncharacterized protein